MATITTLDSQRRNIRVYFLAAPEDQSVCEDIVKHLKPIIRSSPIPIEVNSDFNIPAGTEKEKHKGRLYEADIVLALISVDFIDNDEIYDRNQKVIERYNSRETIMIPILVRNFMWRATPFSSLPVVPKNLQPLNNKQFWNSQDDALSVVVNDIYNSINDLARAQSAAVQALSAPKVESAADRMVPSETSVPQTEPSSPMTELPQPQSAIVQPAPAAKVERAPELTAPAEAPINQIEPAMPMMELPQSQSKAVQPSPAAEVERASGVEAASEPLISQTELSDRMPESTQIQSEAVLPAPAAKVERAPTLETAPGTPMRQTTSLAGASSPIAADWRKKYYRTVLLKRAGAILLDQLLILFIPLVLLLIIFPTISDAALTYLMYGIYFVVMPAMESSKWQGTIGKRILKLQITDREGERITFVRALWRNIMRSLVLYFYFFTFGLLLLAQYFRFAKTRKLFQDELSGTVIGERLASSNAASDVATAAGTAA